MEWSYLSRPQAGGIAIRSTSRLPRCWPHSGYNPQITDMGMQPRLNGLVRSIGLKVVLWALVALYTYVLPDAIIVYRAIESAFGKEEAGKVPLVIVLIVGMAYGLTVILSHRGLKNLLWLVPSGVIAFLIMRLVDNPNKHIHIPEYVLMAWLLFEVLSKDHNGKGIFILIFVYGTLLGVVDEIEQGINPARFYGLSDMAVNSASVLIGVFTLIGLRKVVATNWAWTRRFQELTTLVSLAVFGLIGIVITCSYLFQVQAAGSFWGVYPVWLLLWNALYVLLTGAIALYRGIPRKGHQAPEGARSPGPSAELITARLWTIPLLVILLYMHALAIYVAASGAKFS